MAPAEQAPRRIARPDLSSGIIGRLAVAIPGGLILLFFILQGAQTPELFAGFVLVLGCIALHEFYDMTTTFHPVRLAGFISLIALIAAGTWGDQFQMMIVVVASFPIVFLVSVAIGRTEQATVAIAVTLFGAFWIGLALGHAVLLERLPHGDKVVLVILLGTFLGDTCAYAFGKLFGRHKLAPKLSPNKTFEGLVAGLVGATFVVWFAGLYQPWISDTESLLLGVAVAVAAPIGDLFESLIKRDVGVKDTGRVFGAHGGALDRADAAFFAL
ncbi:MAG: phosphatidate cytidylyltransferase, partial [Thermoleophilaceae bacterium]|nr:phosphatidate cytidylyltransferase [Thermoleophilaceae bacterium]